MISLRIATIPVAQPRQRTRIIKTRDGRLLTGNYTPAKHPVQQFKSDVRAAAQAAIDAPLDGPVELRVIFMLPRPKRLVWKRRAMLRIWHTSRPDLDNLVKAVKDALTGIAWRDDCQVVGLSASKCYASGTEHPGVELSVGEIGDVFARDCALAREGDTE